MQFVYSCLVVEARELSHDFGAFIALSWRSIYIRNPFTCLSHARHFGSVGETASAQLSGLQSMSGCMRIYVRHQMGKRDRIVQAIA